MICSYFMAYADSSITSNHNDSFNGILNIFEELPSLEKAIIVQYTKKMIALNANEQEGFLENSLIKVPSGYKKIQDIKVGDIIYGSSNHEKMVVNIFKQQALRFVCLTKDNEVIHAACHQRFYLPEQDRWIFAQDITPSDIVFSADSKLISFNTVEIIDQDVTTYCITVQDHLFKVSLQDILVHNMDPATGATLMFGFIYIWEPALVILGSIVPCKYASSYSPFKNNGGIITYEQSQEKLSFDLSYNKFQAAKAELLNLHNVLKAINCKFGDQKSLLTYTPIKPNNSPIFF